MEKVSIIGINGSPNKNGICARLLKKALMVAEKRGVKTKIVYLIDIEKKFYHSNYKKVPEEDFKKLGEEILKTDGLILATPVYWLNMSSLMKNFLEKLTVFELQGFKCEGKVAGFIATEEEEGGWQTILNVAGPLNHMGFIFPPYSMVFYKIKLSSKSEKNWMNKDINLLGKNVVELCRMVKSYKPNWDYEKKK